MNREPEGGGGGGVRDPTPYPLSYTFHSKGKNEIAIMCVYSKYFNEGTFKYFNDRLPCPFIYFNS